MCEGNICRSAFASAVLRDRLATHGIDVTSAGTGALVGSDVDPLARLAAQRLVGEFGPWSARQLTSEIIAGADLILSATREQRDQVAALDPRALSRVFALRDFSALLEQWDHLTSPRGGSASLVAQLVAIANEHRGMSVMAQAGTIDIADPYRRGEAAFDRMQEEMLPSLEHIEAAVTALSGLRAQRSAPRAGQPD